MTRGRPRKPPTVPKPVARRRVGKPTSEPQTEFDVRFLDSIQHAADAGLIESATYKALMAATAGIITPGLTLRQIQEFRDVQGRKTPWNNVQLICAALDIDPRWLIDGTPEHAPDWTAHHARAVRRVKLSRAPKPDHKPDRKPDQK